MTYFNFQSYKNADLYIGYAMNFYYIYGSDYMEVVIENRIAEFRKELGLSQHKLAKAVGMKRRSIMAYENNTISPTLETAYKICKVLNKDIKEVFIFK